MTWGEHAWVAQGGGERAQLGECAWGVEKV